MWREAKKKQYCSPKKMNDTSPTCLSMNELQLIAQDYNDSVADSSKHINLKQSKAKLYESIRTALKDYCSDSAEYCWIEQNFIKSHNKKLLQESFRPKKPLAWYKNNRTWLNTFDILNVMKQYEMLYRDFKFFGVFPIDFQSYYSSGHCIGEELCTFDLKKLFLSKKRHFGIVLNLDNHNQSGSHWVSIYGNLDPNKPNFGVYYYDSVSSDTPREARNFMEQVKRQVIEHYGKEIGDKFTVSINPIQKQFKNTECGVFSMVFLSQILHGNDFMHICKYMRDDDGVHEIRDILYRPSLSASKAIAGGKNKKKASPKNK